MKLPNGMHSDGCGLYLRVRDSSRNWFYRYKKDGKLKDLGLGPLSVVPLAKARELATSYRQAWHEGEDPLEKRKKEQMVNTASYPTFVEMIEPCITNLREIRQ